jgi:hypothetical protein
MVEFLFLFSSHGRKKERKKLSLNGLSCIKGTILFFPHGRVWKSFELEGSGVEGGLRRKLEVGFFGEFWKEFILK